MAWGVVLLAFVNLIPFAARFERSSPDWPHQYWFLNTESQWLMVGLGSEDGKVSIDIGPNYHTESGFPPDDSWPRSYSMPVH